MRPQNEKGPVPWQESRPETPMAYATVQRRSVARSARSASVAGRCRPFLWLSAIVRITVAVGLMALMAVFSKSLALRWHLLPETDQVFGIFACTMLALCALAIVLSLSPRRH